jgi:hypothetical protein
MEIIGEYVLSTSHSIAAYQNLFSYAMKDKKLFAEIKYLTNYLMLCSARGELMECHT